MTSPPAVPPGFDDEEHREREAGAADAVRPGGLAIVPYPEVRARLGCAAEVGLVLEDRRSVVKVFFPATDRTFWVDRDHLQAVPADRLPLDPLVARLHRIATLVDAEEVDLYDQHGDVGVYHVFSRGMSLEDLLAVRTMLGDDLRHLRIDPGNMRRTRLTLAFRIPRPA